MLRCYFQSHVFPQFNRLNKLSSLGGESGCRMVGFSGQVVAAYPDNRNEIGLVFSYGL